MLYNITYSKCFSDVDLPKLKKAYITCCIDEFCNIDKLETLQCLYNGSALGGGQRQRISLARTLYRDKPVIFLDEFTSALDEKTELKILENMRRYYPSITLLWFHIVYSL